MKPKHIAIIMDGNRRWAKSNNFPLVEAYERGLETLNDTLKNFIKLKIKYLTVFGFSTESWSRSKKEISFLMKLFNKFLDKAISEAEGNEIRIKFIGDLEAFSKKIKEKASLLSTLTNPEEGLGSVGGLMDVVMKEVQSSFQEGNGEENDLINEAQNIMGKLNGTNLDPVNLMKNMNLDMGKMADLFKK